MPWIFAVLFLAGFYPLNVLLRSNHRSSLFSAVLWSWAAWGGWGFVDGFTDGVYVALCLTGAAFVAVLGARRPQAGPWNFVGLGFLGVMLLPLAEKWFLGSGNLGGVRLLFLAAVLAVGTLNYVPTRFTAAAVVAGCALAVALADQVWDLPDAAAWSARLAVGVVPWLGWYARRPPDAATAFDVLWRDFRDRFGLAWGKRVQEQFNQASHNAGWPGTLRWHGLVGADAGNIDEMTAMLRKMLRRFLPPSPASRQGRSAPTLYDD